MSPSNSPQWKKALHIMEAPVWPLISLVRMVYLAGEYGDFDTLLNDLPCPVEMGHATYSDPKAILAPYLEELSGLLSDQVPIGVTIFDEDGVKLPSFEMREQIYRQRVVEQELEVINSLLCAPMKCDLCCIGPRGEEENLFFEIPLGRDELKDFPLEVISNQETRASTAMDEPPLRIRGREFYTLGPAIVEWRTGHSLILPRDTKCPNLTNTRRCNIYDMRPKTCRKPQIFAYILEKTGEVGHFIYRNKMLAISDCPYVKILKEEIHHYASLCEVDLIVSTNRK